MIAKNGRTISVECYGNNSITNTTKSSPRTASRLDIIFLAV